MEKEVAGIAALYAVIEAVKWIWSNREQTQICILSPDNQKKLDDLHDWHDMVDDEGRRIWYTPKTIHVEQEKMVEMLRDISRNQETTARLLAELINKIDRDRSN